MSKGLFLRIETGFHRLDLQMYQQQKWGFETLFLILKTQAFHLKMYFLYFKAKSSLTKPTRRDVSACSLCDYVMAASSSSNVRNSMHANFQKEQVQKEQYSQELKSARHAKILRNNQKTRKKIQRTEACELPKRTSPEGTIQPRAQVCKA
ncbi:hypothetical protein BD560DRAFT_491998 [Blakeslea trispora]|nr:hypothetical protein BD560DRAFT_491998 [Blakeslea trispora]